MCDAMQAKQLEGKANVPEVVYATDPDAEEGERKVGELVCVRCHNPITSHAARVEVNGRFEHEATNPYGFHFRLGCFATAPGSYPHAERSSFYSWFPGFTWQRCLCGLCNTHLGWLFERGSERFFGLVLDRLRDEPAS